jgi:hypothetical protein
MPIHTLKIWAHKFGKVVLMLEDSCKKKEVHFIYPIDKINDELALTRVAKRIYDERHEGKNRVVHS